MSIRHAAIGAIGAAAACGSAFAAPGEGIPRLGLFGPALHRGLCSKEHVFLRPGASGSLQVQATLSRFLKAQASDYADMSAGLAEAVRTYVRTERASQPDPLGWSGQSGPARLIGVDEAGDDVYLVHRKGGLSHWNIAVDRDGKIEAAYQCEGPEGLSGYDAAHPGPYERGASKP